MELLKVSVATDHTPNQSLRLCCGSSLRGQRRPWGSVGEGSDCQRLLWGCLRPRTILAWLQGPAEPAALFQWAGGITSVVQEDIILLRELHVNHYRFSLSWPRLLPTGIRALTGSAAEQVNKKGIEFYSDLIDALLSSNITPIVTLHHWDLPQLLQVKYGGWQNVSMANYFRDYANLCFEAFGDRVKHWITFSDPRAMAEKGYETGHHAPGLKLRGTGLYKAAHHIIKAHAEAWHSYNTTWRSKQQGLVGISLNCDWGEPVDISNPKDLEAAERYLQFCLGWFANPIYAGDYPQVMKDYIG
ncbi:LCTL isoform 1 [Pan troglodytes]|uniref:LCTL isoform 1 n=1 Tax=Pan troglodytes TaxID=9598 RepID=A0A2J8NR42_PANTR|nr:LCTL isoform 1 [Pan troglodytes]